MDEEIGGYVLAEVFWFVIEGALWGYFAYVCYKFDESYYPEESAEEDAPQKEENKEGDKNKQE